MENDDSNKKQNIINLLREYVQIQMVNGYLSAKIMGKEGMEQVSSKLTSAKNEIVASAKSYGTKAQQIAKETTTIREDKQTVLGEYKKVLDEINNEYNENLKNIIASKEDAEIERQEGDALEVEMRSRRAIVKKSPEYQKFCARYNITKKELMEAVEKKDFETVNKKNEELKKLHEESPTKKYSDTIKKIKVSRRKLDEMIESCEQEIEECRIDRTNKINEASEDRNVQLANIKKQNIFQKAVGNIINKFNGAKKFSDVVVGKLVDKVGKIRNENIPAIKENLRQKSMNVVAKAGNEVAIARNGISNVKDFTLNKAKETGDRIVTVKDQVAENGRTTYKGLQLRIANAKMYQINQMQIRLNRAKETQKERVEKLNNKDVDTEKVVINPNLDNNKTER